MGFAERFVFLKIKIAKLGPKLGGSLGWKFSLLVRYPYECCLLQFCVWMLFIRFVNVGNS